jgi:hypothetical protein
MAFKSYKGVYYLTNPSKYIGKGSNPEYKSNYERVVFQWMDHNKNVIKWGYEIISIPYCSRVDSGIVHEYWPDIIAQVKNEKGEIKTFVMEIKPEKDLAYPPTIKLTNRNKRSYINNLNEKMNYVKNTDKFKAAIAYCKANGYIFRILTEKDIF